MTIRKPPAAAVIVAVVVVSATVLWPAAALGVLEAHTGGGTRQDSLTEQINQLTVAAEQRAGYDRDLFGDYNRDALLATNLAEHGCYYSRADDLCHNDASDVDVDHIIALAEAWDSGAGKWSDTQRDRFAGDPDNLWLMTDELNRAKSDQDIAEWQPPDPAATCDYLHRWLQVKLSYDLTVDRAEMATLDDAARHCQPHPSDPPTGVAAQPTTPTGPTTDAAAASPAGPGDRQAHDADQSGPSAALVTTLVCLLAVALLLTALAVAAQRRRTRARSEG